MPDLETLILRPQDDAEILRDVDRLFADMQVGALALSNCVEEADRPEVAGNKRFDFTELDTFKYLLALLAGHITGDEALYTPIHRGHFSSSHAWHMGMHKRVASINLWLHVAESVQFTLARPTGYDVECPYTFSDEQVFELCHAKPARFDAVPWDLLAFVDFGYPPVTGYSTLHKVEQAPKVERDSRAINVEFGPSLRKSVPLFL